MQIDRFDHHAKTLKEETIKDPFLLTHAHLARETPRAVGFQDVTESIKEEKIKIYIRQRSRRKSTVYLII